MLVIKLLISARDYLFPLPLSISLYAIVSVFLDLFLYKTRTVMLFCNFRPAFYNI